LSEGIKVLEDQKQCDISVVNSYLELPEDFISSILKQVDELCDNIRNGDPDINRTIVVNDNLNNAVSCYKEKLINNGLGSFPHQVTIAAIQSYI